MLHEANEAINELFAITGGTRHITKRGPCRARVRKRPAAHRDPGLQPAVGVLERREATQQRPAAAVHGRHLERRRVKEGKGKVDVREPVQVEVLGPHGLTLSRRCPRLVVANGALSDRIAVARGPVDAAAAAEAALAPGIAELAG